MEIIKVIITYMIGVLVLALMLSFWLDVPTGQGQGQAMKVIQSLYLLFTVSLVVIRERIKI